MAIEKDQSVLVRFGPYTADLKAAELRKHGVRIPLQVQPFQILEVFLDRPHELVTREELQQKLWPTGTFVDFEQGLNKAVNKLRVALCDTADDPRYIETVPKRGYRFVCEVTRIERSTVIAEMPEPNTPTERRLTWAVTLSRGRVVIGAGVGLLILVLAVSGWRTADRNGGLKFWRLKTSSGAAYSNYQTGRVLIERQHPGDYEEALRSFETAIRLDPNYAAAYAGKADAKIFLYWDSGSHDDIAQARMAIGKALELDPNNAYAHTLACRIRSTYDWDFSGAEAECRRAVELDPENHEARREMAFLLNSMGRREDALREMDVAIALAPTSFNKRSRGLLLYFDRRFDDAIAQFKQVEETDPEYAESSRWIARCLEQKRDYERALDFLIRFRQSEGASAEEIEQLRHAFTAGGWPELLRTSLANARTTANLEAAGSFAQLGENDKAFDSLESMIKARRVMIVHMDSDPRLDPLRSDPRFELMAQRVGLR